MTYTVLAYKQDSKDFCMGCLMASYGSDFEFEAFKTEQEAIDFAAKFLAYDRKIGETGYDVTILVNGRNWWDDVACEECVASERIIAAASVLGKKLRDGRKERQALDKQKAEEAKKKNQEAVREAHDVREYARLKAKFKDM
jgi:hypothetical protein